MTRARLVAVQAALIIPANCWAFYVIWTRGYTPFVVLPGMAIALTLARLLAAVTGGGR